MKKNQGLEIEENQFGFGCKGRNKTTLNDRDANLNCTCK